MITTTLPVSTVRGAAELLAQMGPSAAFQAIGVGVCWRAEDMRDLAGPLRALADLLESFGGPDDLVPVTP